MNLFLRSEANQSRITVIKEKKYLSAFLLLKKLVLLDLCVKDDYIAQKQIKIIVEKIN